MRSIFDYNEHLYLDRPDFKRYVKKIYRILISTPYAMSVREIHLALGDEMKREWTADALERLKVDDIDEIGILPTRYYVRGRDPKLQYDNSKL